MMKIDKYLEDYPATTSTELDPIFKMFKSDVAKLAEKWRKGQLYLYDYQEALETLTDGDENEQTIENINQVKQSGEEALFLIDENNVLTIVKGEL